MSTSSNSSNNSNNSLASIQLDFIKGDPLQVADALKSHTPLVLEFWATWVRLCFCFRNQSVGFGFGTDNSARSVRRAAPAFHT
jgi:hypothetical protein